MRILYYISFKYVFFFFFCFLRCLRDFEKWSWLGKIGKNGQKIGKNSCPRIRKYILLTSIFRPQKMLLPF